MKWNRSQLTIAGVLLGFLAGCTDRHTPTSPNQPTLAFDASASLTSGVTDPAGDAAWNRNTGPGAEAKVPDYLDIVTAAVSKKGGTFAFTMSLADVLPASPQPASGGLGTYDWFFELDTDPATFPSGKDGVFPQNQALPIEFFVAVEWDGVQFTGVLFDLRPLLTGRPMILTPVAFSIGGTRPISDGLRRRAPGTRITRQTEFNASTARPTGASPPGRSRDAAVVRRVTPRTAAARSHDR